MCARARACVCVCVCTHGRTGTCVCARARAMQGARGGQAVVVQRVGLWAGWCGGGGLWCLHGGAVVCCGGLWSAVVCHTLTNAVAGKHISDSVVLQQKIDLAKVLLNIACFSNVHTKDVKSKQLPRDCLLPFE